MWQVSEDGLETKTCATLTDARQHVEDRAVDIWDRLVDLNRPPRRVFRGVKWDIEARENKAVVTATMEFPDESPSKEWEIRYVRD